MRKKFVANIGFLLLLNFLVKPFWILGVDRSVQNEVGPDAYGIYFALFNFSYLFQIILDFGINNYNNRLIAQEPSRLSSHLFSTLAVKIILSVIYCVVLLIAAFGVNFNNEQIGLLALLMILQISMSFYSFFRSNINALQLFKTDSVLSVLDKLITSIICILILWTNVFDFEISITNFIWAQITGYLIPLAVAMIIIQQKKIKIIRNFDPALIKEIFKKSLPYALLGFLMTAYYRADGVMLERILKDEGAYEAGIYASAFRLLDALNILGFMFAGLLLPMFSRMLETKVDIKPLLDLGFKLMLVFSLVAGITCIFYRLEIMQLLYVTGDKYSASILGWLMISFIAMSITYIYGSLITASGNIQKLIQISLAGFFLNIVLNLILIPEIKALGSAIATAVAQLMILFAHIVITHKLFSIPFTEKKWIRTAVFILLALIINRLMLELNIGWYYKFTLAALFTAFAAIPAGLITRQELRSALTMVPFTGSRDR